MDEQKVFCQKCKQRIFPQKRGMIDRIMKKPQTTYEFADGFMCKACAEIEVKKKRK